MAIKEFYGFSNTLLLFFLGGSRLWIFLETPIYSGMRKSFEFSTGNIFSVNKLWSSITTVLHVKRQTDVMLT